MNKFIFIFCFLSSSLLFADDGKNKLSELDLFLCIGQSNMAGRAYLSSDVMDTLTNVYLLNEKGCFERAVNPLNKYSTIRKEMSMQRLGPSYSFAKEVANKTGHAVGLIVNARGNTSIESWEKGSKDGYYNEALKRAKEGMKYGKLKAIIWHQGEANVNSPAKYRKQLSILIRDLRKDLGIPGLFFIIGEISRWNWTKKGVGTCKFNDMLRTVSNDISNSTCVSSEGLSPMKDETDPHFDINSQLILGKRYATEVLRHCY